MRIKPSRTSNPCKVGIIELIDAKLILNHCSQSEITLIEFHSRGANWEFSRENQLQPSCRQRFFGNVNRERRGKLNTREVKEMLLANGTRYQLPVKRIWCEIDFSMKRVSRIRHVTLPDFKMVANMVAEA